MFEAASGEYFVVTRDEGGEKTIPVTPTTAGMILAEENRRHMSRIFERKLTLAAIGNVGGRSFDTTKDALIWMDCDDEVEAVATYRTNNGVEYMRLVSPWDDTVVLFSKSDLDKAVESAEVWVGCGRSFIKHIDWPFPVEPASMTGVAVNERAHEATAWSQLRKQGATPDGK